MAAHRRGRSTPQVLQFARWRLEFHARLLLLPAGVVVYTASDAALSEVSAGHCNFVTDSPAGNSVRMSSGDCRNQIICSNRACHKPADRKRQHFFTGNATLKHTQIRTQLSRFLRYQEGVLGVQTCQSRPVNFHRSDEEVLRQCV